MGYWILAQAAWETAVISVPTILQAAIGRTDMAACNARLASWSKRLVAQAQIKMQVEGREHIADGTPYIVMSNHQSHYDIPVVFQATGIPLRMIAKKELFSIPLMGRAMTESGFVEIDRKARRKAITQLGNAEQRLKQLGLSVWIAPEGTRSTDGTVGAFKTGGFHLAKSARVPILPVTVRGTHDVHCPGDRQVHRGRDVSVRIHPAISPEEIAQASIRDTMERVRAAIVSGFEDGR